MAGLYDKGRERGEPSMAWAAGLSPGKLPCMSVNLCKINVFPREFIPRESAAEKAPKRIQWKQDR